MPELCRQLLSILPLLADDFEVILVDDGSRDGSWDQISAWGDRHPQIKGLKFSPNFGHHYAHHCGVGPCYR